MNFEYYKYKMETSKDLEDSYKTLQEAFNNDSIGKRDYAVLHGTFLQAKAEFDRLERLEEGFIDKPKDLDIKELVIAVLWKSDEFTDRTSNGSLNDGSIINIKIKELEAWLKIYLDKQ